jgi:hypothetical protein
LCSSQLVSKSLKSCEKRRAIDGPNDFSQFRQKFEGSRVVDSRNYISSTRRKRPRFSSPQNLRKSFWPARGGRVCSECLRNSEKNFRPSPIFDLMTTTQRLRRISLKEQK